MADLPVLAPAKPAQDEPADPTSADPNAPAPNQPVPANAAGQPMPVPNPSVPNQSAPMQPTPVAPQIMHQQVLNWSPFKPEFAGRPEEEVEAHLLCTNDWMITHNFPNDEKVQRFCLALVGEARLWYESLTPIANDWPALQENFGRQYSKIGNTREQLLCVWRSFPNDKTTETVDPYVNSIRQVVAMLGYGKLQILEVFKNTIPNRLYLILFPMDNLRVAFEIAKRVLTKEKIDR